RRASRAGNAVWRARHPAQATDDRAGGQPGSATQGLRDHGYRVPDPRTGRRAHVPPRSPVRPDPGRKPVRTLTVFVDYDKEEAWLNDMADRGHLVVKAGPRYSFVPIEPGTAVVRVDHQPGMKASDFDDYRNLFADAGWQHLAGSRGSGEQYFASFSGDANADIFSENESKAQRYRRAMTTNSAILLPLSVTVVALWSTWNVSPEAFLSPRDLYL